MTIVSLADPLGTQQLFVQPRHPLGFIVPTGIGYTGSQYVADIYGDPCAKILD